MDDSAFKGLKMQTKDDKACVSKVMDVLVKSVVSQKDHHVTLTMHIRVEWKSLF